MKRKTRRRKINYFGPIEEEAVTLFLESDDTHFRNEIYNKWLRTPLDKMAESIIRKYKLFRKGVSFDDLHADTLSFLITKSERFDSKKGKRAYSYFGTIIKNRLLGELIKDEKAKVNTLGYDDFSSSIEKRDDMSYEMNDTPENNIKQLLNSFRLTIENKLIRNEDLIERGYKPIFNENQVLIGNALIEVFSDWKRLFGDLDGSNKYNKNLITATIVEMTFLKPKEVRSGIRKFKDEYINVKDNYINKGFI